MVGRFSIEVIPKEGDMNNYTKQRKNFMSDDQTAERKLLRPRSKACRGSIRQTTTPDLYFFDCSICGRRPQPLDLQKDVYNL